MIKKVKTQRSVSPYPSRSLMNLLLILVALVVGSSSAWADISTKTITSTTIFTNFTSEGIAAENWISYSGSSYNTDGTKNYINPLTDENLNNSSKQAANGAQVKNRIPLTFKVKGATKVTVYSYHTNGSASRELYVKTSESNMNTVMVTVGTAVKTSLDIDPLEENTITVATNESNGVFVYAIKFEVVTPHTVTFDAGSFGTCATSSLTEESAGAGVILPWVNSKDGYKFEGWSTESNPESADAGGATSTYNPTSDCTLYAYYTTLTDATIPTIADVTCNVGDNITLTGSATATNDGGRIAGVTDFNGGKAYRWSTCNADGSGIKWISSQQSATYSPSTATPGKYYYRFMCVENVANQQGYKTTYSNVITVTVKGTTEISLSPSETTFNVDVNSTKNITLSSASDGAFSASSSNDAITASVSGNILTLTTGSSTPSNVTVTISQAATDIYSAPTPVSLTVSVVKKNMSAPIISCTDNEVSITPPVAGATIYYTTDGTDPKTSGTKQTYSSPFAINQNTTVKAYSTANDYNDSGVRSYDAKYQEEGPMSKLLTITSNYTYVPTKELKPGSEGMYDDDNRVYAVGSLSYGSNGLVVKNSNNYIAIKVAAGANVQAIGKRHGGKTESEDRIMYLGTSAGGNDLAEQTIPYGEVKSLILTNLGSEQIIYISANDRDLDVQKIIITFLDAPTFSPASGSNIELGAPITLTAADGSTIYGTWGSTYQEAGTVKANAHESGASPLVVHPNQSGEWVLQAVAEKDGELSLISSATYTILPHYTVTFDANGGSEVDPIQQTSSTASITLPVTERSEYNFDGWYTQRTGGEKKDDFVPTSNITLYAHWTKHTVYEGTTIGSTTLNDNTWWSAFSQYTTLKQGIKYHFSFKNWGNGANEWANWCLAAANSEAHAIQDNPEYVEYFLLRSDNNGWGDKYNVPSTCDYKDIWSDYIAAMKNGANVEMDVTYTASGTIKVDAVVNGIWNYNFESKNDIPDNPVVFFIVDHSYITDFTVTVPTYTYYLNAVDGEDNVIDVIETGTTTEGTDVYFPLAFELNGTIYKTTETPYKKTFGPASSTDDQTKEVTYSIDNTIVAYTEGEAGAKNVQNDNYSKGYDGHVNGQNYSSRGVDMGTLQPGVYKLVTMITNRADRGIVIRNVTNSGDYKADILVSLTSGSGVTTSSAFTITSPTKIRINGNDGTGNKSGQSADFDYAYIQCVDGLVIRTQPVGATYYANAHALPLTVDAYAYKNGFVTPTYQWYSNTTASNVSGTPIDGATEASYTPSTTVASEKYYYCVVSYDGLTSQTSDAVLVKVVDGIECGNDPHHVSTGGTIPSGMWWTNFSDSYQLDSAKERTFTFNVQGGAEHWNNWYLVLSSAPAHNGDEKYDASFEKLIIRGDAYGWDEGYNRKAASLIRVKTDGTKENLGVETTDATFISDMKNATVSVKVSYSGTTAYIYSKITNTASGSTYYLTETSNSITAGTLYLFFGTDASTISNFSAQDEINAYSISAEMSTPKAGLLQIKNSDDIEVPNGTYVGTGSSYTVTADLYSGYSMTGWTYEGTQGTANGFTYSISAINDNTVVTATTGASAYSFAPKGGEINPSYIYRKGTDAAIQDFLSINNLGGASVEWTCEVVTDASTTFNAKSNLSVTNKTTTGFTISSPQYTDGGSIVVTALINGTDKLSYVVTVPYIGKHTYDMHAMADRAEVKADGHWSLGYELINGAHHKDPLVQLGDIMSGNNAAVVSETNGLYITTGDVNNLGMSVMSGATSNTTDEYTIADVTGVNLLALKNATVTIPQVKREWFLKLYLDPHAGGSHDRGAGSEFTITNVKDLEGKAIAATDVLCTNGVQWDRNGGFDQKTSDKGFRGCMIFRIADDGDVNITFLNKGWNKLVRAVVTNEFSTEMELGSTYEGKDVGNRTVDYKRWNHTWTHRVYDDVTGETGNGIEISYNGDPNCKAENAFLIDHKIVETEGTVNCSAMSDNPWESQGHVTYWAGKTNAGTGVGNVKIRSNATYQAGTVDAYNTWSSGGPDKRYVLNCNESWIVVGKLKVQKYPYTWDFDGYNMDAVAEADRTIKKITEYTSDNNYGTWSSGATNNIVKVPASEGDDANEKSPFYIVDENNSDNKNYTDVKIYKPLWAQGSQLTLGTATIPETEGLGISVNSMIDAPVDGNGNSGMAINNVTFSAEKGLYVTGRDDTRADRLTYSVTIPEVPANMYVFVKSSAAPVGVSANAVTDNSFASYSNTPGDGLTVTVYRVNTAGDVVLTFAKGHASTDGVYVKKIAVTDQVKTLNKFGYATESRTIAIDYNETKDFSINANAYYVVKGSQENEVIFTKVEEGQKITASDNNGCNKGLVLFADIDAQANIPLFVPAVNITTDQSNSLSGNLMMASPASESIELPDEDAGYTNYVLTNYYYKKSDGYSQKYESDVVAFYKQIRTSTLTENKSYLRVPDDLWETPAAAKSLYVFFRFFDEGVDDSTTEVDNAPAIVEKRDDVFYTINGIRISGTPKTKGIYIRNGKKYYVK